MGLLESTNVVRAIASHQSVVAHLLETEKDVLFLLGRHTSVDPGVAEDGEPGLLALELGESVTGNAEILGLDNFGINRLGRVHRDADLVVHTSPDELVAVVVVFGGVENEDLTVYNLDIASDVDGG
ncbi:hypothetical protein HYQ46_008489 [Verticillium longisporum]|nr:hypothetical protein HYQ46_008489 [Verticillium longisporum]